MTLKGRHVRLAWLPDQAFVLPPPSDGSAVFFDSRSGVEDER